MYSLNMFTNVVEKRKRERERKKSQESRRRISKVHRDREPLRARENSRNISEDQRKNKRDQILLKSRQCKRKLLFKMTALHK